MGVSAPSLHRESTDTLNAITDQRQRQHVKNGGAR